MISGNMVGSYSQMGKTLILIDEDGNEITGVIVGQETVFTAGDNDVREGFVYAGDSGMSTGTKDIPAYHTSEGYKLIPAGSDVKITGAADYDYTKLQVLICTFNTEASDSVATEKVSINGNVYAANSSEIISTVTIDSENKTINLGFTNNGKTSLIVRYFMYKEIY